MRLTIFQKMVAMASLACLLSACATPMTPFDYAAFKQSRPRSILVLPPLNNSPDVNATFSVLSHMTYPLAEGGYYVMPVTLVVETFKQNGLINPAEIHAVAPTKLQEIFGADAALYVAIDRYGSTYAVFDSGAVVSASAKLVDLKTGQTLWTGSASASSNESQGNQQGGLAGLLVAALLKQVLNNVTDMSYRVAGVASDRLLAAGKSNGMLYGPRSPQFGKD